jgi:hypothetical protein
MVQLKKLRGIKNTINPISKIIEWIKPRLFEANKI